MKKNVMVALIATALGMTFGSKALAAGDAEAGKAKTAVCASCHAADGNSAVASFPKLAGQGEKYLLKQMKDVLEGNRVIVEMTGILDGLSEQDLADIAAFYAAQSISLGQADPELAKKGEKLYRAGNPAKNVAACMACHGPAGKGIDLAVFPALGGQHAEYTSKQLMLFRSGERMNDGDARMMRSIAARLSDKEIEALANYISGLH